MPTEGMHLGCSQEDQLKPYVATHRPCAPGPTTFRLSSLVSHQRAALAWSQPHCWNSRCTRNLGAVVSGVHWLGTRQQVRQAWPRVWCNVEEVALLSVPNCNISRRLRNQTIQCTSVAA